MMEDAIRWFEKCERTLSVNANLHARNRDGHDFSNTQRISSVRGQRGYGSDFEVSPLMLKRGDFLFFLILRQEDKIKANSII